MERHRMLTLLMLTILIVGVMSLLYLSDSKASYTDLGATSWKKFYNPVLREISEAIPAVFECSKYPVPGSSAYPSYCDFLPLVMIPKIMPAAKAALECMMYYPSPARSEGYPDPRSYCNFLPITTK